MSSQPTTQPPFESRYPELSLPPGGWKSTLPEHLLEGADSQTLFIMTELSKASQANDFACHGVVELSKHLRALNGKTYRNEKAVGDAQADLDTLKDQAKVVTPFIKPLSMFASLWEYTAFRWVFFAGCAFFLLVLYPWLLRMGLLDLLDSFLKGG